MTASVEGFSVGKDYWYALNNENTFYTLEI